jgi:hypothetical protein
MKHSGGSPIQYLSLPCNCQEFLKPNARAYRLAEAGEMASFPAISRIVPSFRNISLRNLTLNSEWRSRPVYGGDPASFPL